MLFPVSAARYKFISTVKGAQGAADKSTNFYRLDTESYNKLLTTSINKAYKKAPANTVSNIISQEKKIAKNLALAD